MTLCLGNSVYLDWGVFICVCVYICVCVCIQKPVDSVLEVPGILLLRALASALPSACVQAALHTPLTEGHWLWVVPEALGKVCRCLVMD